MRQMRGRSVRAARNRKRPLGHWGQRCRSRAKTRWRSGAYPQRDAAGLCLAAWLAGRWWEGAPPLAGCGHTAPLPDWMHTRRRDQRRPLLQPLYRRPLDPHCASGAGPSEGVEDLPVGILFQALQGHRTPGGVADEPSQRVSAVGGNMRIGRLYDKRS